MPRKRTVAITEAIHVLRRHESEAHDRTSRLRIAVLRTLKESPSMTIAELAGVLECPVRTIMKWLAVYRDHGLDGVLSIGSHCLTIPSSIEREIEQRLVIGQFRTTTQVRSWLKRTHDITASLPAIASLLNRCTHAHSGRANAKAIGDKEPSRDRHEDIRIALWLHDFTMSLPERITSRAWIEEFKQALANVLAVERVTVAINFGAMQPKPLAASHSISIQEVMEAGGQVPSSVTVRSIDRVVPRANQIIKDLVDQGLDLENYHEPFAQEFELHDGTFLGTIILWQPMDREDMRLSSKALLLQMRQVLMRMMIDCAARHEVAKPNTRQFYGSLRQLVFECNLTPAEEQAMTMQLLGHAYKEIADAMKTSIENVGKLLTSVHKKTATTGVAELNAKLFSPRVG